MRTAYRSSITSSRLRVRTAHNSKTISLCPRVRNALGEVVRDDKEVLRRMVTHLCSLTDCCLTPAADPLGPKVGEWLRLAAREAVAPPGKLRMYLLHEDSIRRVVAALRNQLIRVGLNTIASAVSNVASLACLPRGKGPGGAA